MPSPWSGPFDDRTGTNQGRNRDADDPLGGDHALLPAGGARGKPHVTGATTVRAAMEAGHADRHRHPLQSLLRRQDHLDGQPLGPLRLRNSQPREVWENALDEHLDLTDRHLRQIHGMREVLEPATFDDLYEKLVTKRVARRVLERTFGVDPRRLREGE